LPGQGLKIALGDGGSEGLPARMAVGIRPEDVIVAPTASHEASLPGRVVWVERLGSRNVIEFRLGDRSACATVPPDHPVQATGTAWFGFPADRRHILDRASERFIRIRG
jgi:ABC-type sugar transport system ATPase subunit